MTRAKIRNMYSLEVGDLQKFTPSKIDDFAIAIRVIVGPDNEPGEESFDIQVCTPKWLAKECETAFAVAGRHRLIVAYYDYSRIYSVITELIETNREDSWRKVAEKVSRIGYWEFEDYREAPSKVEGRTSD